MLLHVLCRPDVTGIFRSRARLNDGPVQRNSYEVLRCAASPPVWAETAVDLFGEHTSEGGDSADFHNVHNSTYPD